MNSKFHLDYSFVFTPISFENTLLMQLGRIYCSPGYIVEEHAHLNWYELTVITEGEGDIITNNVKTSVKKGDIYFSFPGDFHKIISSNDNPLKYDYLSFNTINSSLQEELSTIVKIYSYTERIFYDEEIRYLTNKVIAEISSENQYKNQILTLCFEQIIFHILRHFNGSKKLPQKKYSSVADELCYQIMNHIDINIQTIQNLHEISDIFGYNYSYLSHLFKKYTNTTILDYYSNKKLTVAKLLIDEGKMKINQISESLNYSSPYAFSNAFKKKFGIAPRTYQARKK